MTPEDVRPIFGHDGKRERQRPVEIRDVAPGLWIWRLEHPHWKPGQGWDPIVACTCVESRGEVLVLDPLAPTTDSTEVWQRLDSRPPTAIVVLKPDHVRDADLFVRRYHARAFGPRLFFRHDIPKPSWSGSIRGTGFPEGSSRSMTVGVAMRHHFGCPSSVPLFSQMPSPPRKANSMCGRRRGIRSERCQPYGRCSIFRSTT